MSTLASLESWTPEQQLQALKERAPLSTAQFSFTPLPSDVIVAPTYKSGTSWLLYICHQLRMQGAEPDFNRLEDVIANIEHEESWLGENPNSKPQPALPRIFESHLPHARLPKGGKIIYCFRDQKDVVYSLYWHLDDLQLFRGRVSLSVFAQAITENTGLIINVADVLRDLVIWWEHRHDDNILFLFYDDLKENPEACIRRIAAFIGVECSEEVLHRVVHNTSHAEMVRHHSKFRLSRYSDVAAKKYGERFHQSETRKQVGRVRQNGGHSGDGQFLPLKTRQFIDKLWNEIVEEKLGFKSLKEMQEEWQKERSLEEELVCKI